MPDRRNKWDECHRIYPRIGEMLDWANDIREKNMAGRDSLSYCDSDRKLGRPSCAEGPYPIPHP